jgi:carbon-monoxide dehydrogenase medium subunit/xanthine dehydrogenase FAD-binding subunit
LVDISELAELGCIVERDDAIIVGAGITHSIAGEDALVCRDVPLLARACECIGSWQIRNRGTIGGNVANAAACADTMPALACHGATAQVSAREGDFEVPVADVVTAPGETSLPPGSLIRGFRIPKLNGIAGSAYFKVGRRHALSTARVSVACLGWQDEELHVTEVRVVVGACTPRTQRFDRVEAILVGRKPTEDLAREAGLAGAEQMISLAGRRWSTDYKAKAVSALIERSVRQVFGLAEEA